MLLPIRFYEFDRPDRFQPGHTIDEFEASVLNRLRANAAREHWQKLLPRTKILGPDELDSAKYAFEFWARSYVLPAPQPLKPQWTLEAEQRLMREEGLGSRSDFETLSRTRFKTRLGADLFLSDQSAEDIL